MLKRINLVAAGAALTFAASAALAAGGIGGPGASLGASPLAMNKMMGGMAAMHEAMTAKRAGQPTADGFAFVGGEAGWVLQGPASNTAKPAVSQGISSADSVANRSTIDLWNFAGGEAGWVLTPHEYEFRGGKLIYVDQRFPHDTPTAVKPSPDEQARTWGKLGGG